MGIELKSHYKYVGISIFITYNDSTSFTPLIQQLIKMLKPTLSFYFGFRSCISFEVKKKRVASTFSVFDSSIYARLCSKLIYHWALRFVTHFKAGGLPCHHANSNIGISSFISVSKVCFPFFSSPTLLRKIQELITLLLGSYISACSWDQGWIWGKSFQVCCSLWLQQPIKRLETEWTEYIGYFSADLEFDLNHKITVCGEDVSLQRRRGHIFFFSFFFPWGIFIEKLSLDISNQIKLKL